MSEKIKKNSSLTIRIKCKTKEDLNKIVKKKGLTMSELVNEYLVDMVEKENLKEEHKEQLEKSTIEFEEKLINLKQKMGWV